MIWSLAHYAGFAAAPVARNVADTNGAVLTTLFVAGIIDLEPLRLTATALGNGMFRLFFFGIASQSYAIEFSRDLLVWCPISTNSSEIAEHEFMDASTASNKFYRVRLLP